MDSSESRIVRGLYFVFPLYKMTSVVYESPQYRVYCMLSCYLHYVALHCITLQLRLHYITLRVHKHGFDYSTEQHTILHCISLYCLTLPYITLGSV